MIENFLYSIDWYTILVALAKIIVLQQIVLGLVSYTVYAERRVSALMQDRLGPNRVGFPLTLLGFKKDFSPFLGGLGQPIADALKLFLKEDFMPAGVNKLYYCIAPALGITAVFVMLAVIPFGSTLFGEPMVIANLNVGPLFVFAISSLGVYGIVLAGWSANSKFPFLGGIRASSQMISYELAMGLSIIPVIMIFGNLNLGKIVEYQVQNGWLIFPFTDGHFSLLKLLLWVPCLISFIIFSVSLFAETNRLPFDLPEAETELVAGYHTEYSSMKFALFFLGEYAAMIAGSGLVVTLFLGGWHLPFIPDGSQGWFWGLVNIAVFFAKVSVLLLIFIWIRWTLPRFRYDQLMKLGWIWFFEIALVNVFLTAAILAFVH
ncbi:MAG: NADH-quinone oxidoreductase subunit H [Chthoniobacteraceae bacterium]